MIAGTLLPHLTGSGKTGLASNPSHVGNRSVQPERGSLQKAVNTNGLDRAKVLGSFSLHHLVSTATIDGLMTPWGVLKTGRSHSCPAGLDRSTIGDSGDADK